MKFPLKTPIKFGTETISEFELRRLKAKDFRSLPAELGFDDMLSLASASAAQPPSVIDELDAEDMTALMAVVAGFLGSSPKIGKRR